MTSTQVVSLPLDEWCTKFAGIDDYLNQIEKTERNTSVVMVSNDSHQALVYESDRVDTD